jgi:hypothetical protein
VLPGQILEDQRRQCVGLTNSRSRVEALIQPLVVRRQAKINGCTRLPSITASSRSQSYGAVDIPSHTRGSSIVLTWQRRSRLPWTDHSAGASNVRQSFIEATRIAASGLVVLTQLKTPKSCQRTITPRVRSQPWRQSLPVVGTVRRRRSRRPHTSATDLLPYRPPYQVPRRPPHALHQA